MWALTDFEEKRHLLIAIAQITDLSHIREAAMTVQSGLLMRNEINRLDQIYIVARYRASIDYERQERK
jgi:hypothetical protein